MSAIAPSPLAVFDVDTAGFDALVIQASHHTPVLVDFWAAWCGPCKALGPVLEKLAHEAGGDFVLAKIDTDANQELAASMGIRSLPTVRLFVDGAPVAEFMGVHPESAIRTFLEQHLPQSVDSGEIDAIAALLAGGERDAARVAIEALDASVRESPAGTRLKAQLWILDSAAGLRPCADAQAALRTDPDDLQARYESSVHLAASGQFEDAMDGLLRVLGRNKNLADGAARESMLRIFEAMGADDPRVGTYRGRLASALN